MTGSERRRAEELVAVLDASAVSDVSADAERYGLIAKMLLTYPVANASAESGKARGEAYREALNDIPPAVLDAAIKRWNRGEAGDHDYRWAPAPATLRGVCQKIREPLFAAAEDLKALLGAVSIERAMDPKPIEADATTVPALRSMA